LNYDFEKAIVANSFKAHRLLHLAKQNQVQNECEEKLFEAYFIHGKNIDDNDVLLELGLSLGIDLDSILDMLSSDAFASDVESDIYQAQQIGVQGVPFFVFDNKYAISGAQLSETFLAALYKAKQS